MAGTIPAVSRDGVLTVTDDASHSATLLYHMADHALDGLEPNGAQTIEIESAGHIVGLRQGARAKPTFAVSAVVAAGLSAFEAMLLGETSGFISTTLAIGDEVTTDVSWTFPYGAETRTVLMQDVRWKIGKKAGDPMVASYTAIVYGPVSIDGTTIIAAR